MTVIVIFGGNSIFLPGLRMGFVQHWWSECVPLAPLVVLPDWEHVQFENITDGAEKEQYFEQKH